MKSRYSSSIKAVAVFIILFFIFQIQPAKAMEALGWGWIMNAEGTASSPGSPSPGLISFNCESQTPTPSLCKASPGPSELQDYNVNVDTESGDVTGWAWIALSDATYAIGGIKFSPNADDYKIDNSTNYYMLSGGPGERDLPDFNGDGSPDALEGAHYDQSGELSGYARIMELGRYGWETYTSNEWGWIKLNGTCGTDCNYGVSFVRDYYPNDNNDLTAGYDQTTYGRFLGYGWNWQPVVGTGFGLIDFDVSQSDTAANAWLQTLYGDVYSAGDFSAGTPPTGQFNASYLILSGGSISSFSTEMTVGGSISGYDELLYPILDTNIYRSNIGRIDIGKLETDSERLILVSDIDGIPLDNKVYETVGDFTIDDSLTIANGSGLKGTVNALGNGTIIINGNLTIEHNIDYDSSVPANMYNLASVAWIVKGEVTIDSNVTIVSGNFIVLGDDDLATNDGNISTGTGNQSLIVNGLMMAYGFNFDRERTTVEDASVPSEQIIYDGRVLINTPPGLEDLMATLPELNIATP